MSRAQEDFSSGHVQAKAPLSDDVEVHSGSNSTDNAVSQEAQPGVQNIEAVTVVWGTTALAAAYILIWLTYFVEGLLSGRFLLPQYDPLSLTDPRL